MRDDEPWFVAADVCRALNIAQVTNTIRRLDDDEKALISVKGISRGNDQVSIVNESGLYSLILGRRKAEAKFFKRWITHEVIPSLRKTDSYSVASRKPDNCMIPDPVERAKRWIEEEEIRQRLAATNRAWWRKI
nr:MAG TPA: repressor domain protein [Caudoviricetes sp.]